MAAVESGECVFCALPPERITVSNEHAVAINDAYPVSTGHCLVIPRRHVADWWQLSDEERDSITELVDQLRAQLLEKHLPQGFNVGFNDGAAAGQTVLHFHMHVIPRYDGDVSDPRGGVRHVIPAKANYLDPKSAHGSWPLSSPSSYRTLTVMRICQHAPASAPTNGLTC